MPNKTVLTPAIIDKVKELSDKGLKRQEIADAVGIGYGTVFRVLGPTKRINRKLKEDWTIENLSKLKDVYMTTPIKEVCLMFNRTRYEIRSLLGALGWAIPEFYFQQPKEETIEKIRSLSKEYNQTQIAALLKLSKASIQSICSTYNIKCAEIKQKKFTAKQFMDNAYREQADSIREKLNGKYSKKEKINAEE